MHVSYLTDIQIAQSLNENERYTQSIKNHTKDPVKELSLITWY